MNKKSWIIFTFVTVGILVLLITVSKNSQNYDLSQVNEFEYQVASEQNGQIADHVLGNENSKVILINYGDFQCSGCAGVHPIVKNITEKYKDKIKFIFRNFILPYHTNAKAAAAAAEAAGFQGKYWKMHDLIYESQPSWESLNVEDRTSFFNSLAETIDLDMNQFKIDMGNERLVKKMTFDYNLGIKSGVKATPSFYLNGQPLDSEVWGDESALSKRIDEELIKQSK
ncbi:MAG: thioredoxin domain-containing protein [Candidatus Saccharimonadales bacterium]